MLIVQSMSKKIEKMIVVEMVFQGVYFYDIHYYIYEVF